MRTLTRISAVAASGALLAGIAAAPAFAQGTPSYPNGQNVATSVVVDEQDSLTLNTTSMDLGHGLAGQHVTGTVTGSVSTNDAAGYKVQVQSTQVNFNGPGTNAFPVGDLVVNGNPMDTTPQTTDSSAHASGASGDAFSDAYGLNIPNVSPGTYTDVLQYTLVPN